MAGKLDDDVVLVEVKEQQVLIRCQSEHAKPATLFTSPHPNLSIRLNCRPVGNEIRINPNDTLEVRLDSQPPLRRAKIETDNRGATATVIIDMKAGINRTFNPVPESAVAHLAVVERADHPAPFRVEEIIRLAREAGVKRPLDEAAIAEAVQTGLSARTPIAYALPPKDEEPEHLEVLIQMEAERELIGVIPVRPVLTVKQGVRIGTAFPQIPGQAGETVRGEPIEPRRFPESHVKLGHGVRRDGNDVYAARSGRMLVRNQFVDVIEVLERHGSHRALDGHIVFDGDVVVYGDVEEGVEIHAGGRVTVTGNVSRAMIVADQGIEIGGNVFRSICSAGTRVQALQSLHADLASFVSDFYTFLAAIKQVQGTLEARGTPAIEAGRIAAALLPEKFPDILNWHQRFETFRMNHEAILGKAWLSFLHLLENEISRSKLTSVRDADQWNVLIRMVETKISQMDTTPSEEASIRLKNAQNAELSAKDALVSLGQGLYQCKIRSHGVHVPHGVILACTVNAVQVHAHEIGSQSGGHTFIQVEGKDGTISAEVIHAETTLLCGRSGERLTEDWFDVVWPERGDDAGNKGSRRPSVVE